MPLQAVLVLLGIGTLAFLLWEPHLEGRNAHASTFDIYFKDPFLAYVYVGSTPFFIALYRAFHLLEHVRQNGAFSLRTVDELRAIKRCAIVLIGFVAGALLLIILFGDPDDRPAGLFMCLFDPMSQTINTAETSHRCHTVRPPIVARTRTLAPTAALLDTSPSRNTGQAAPRDDWCNRASGRAAWPQPAHRAAGSASHPYPAQPGLCEEKPHSVRASSP